MGEVSLLMELSLGRGSGRVVWWVGMYCWWQALLVFLSPEATTELAQAARTVSPLPEKRWLRVATRQITENRCRLFCTTLLMNSLTQILTLSQVRFEVLSIKPLNDLDNNLFHKLANWGREESCLPQTTKALSGKDRRQPLAASCLFVLDCVLSSFSVKGFQIRVCGVYTWTTQHLPLLKVLFRC